MAMFLEALNKFHTGQIEERELFGCLPTAVAKDESQCAGLMSDLNQARIKGWIDAALYQRLHLAIVEVAEATVITERNKGQAPPRRRSLGTHSSGAPVPEPGMDDLTRVGAKIPISDDNTRIAMRPSLVKAGTTTRQESNDATVAARRAPPVRPNADDDTVMRMTSDMTTLVDPEVEEPTEIAEQTDLAYSQNGHVIPALDRADASVEYMIGRSIKGRFVLEECIGRGGMGTVFKALDLRKVEFDDRNPFVAIKFLNHELRDTEEALFALQREAKKSQALAHPNIVTVHDFDRDGELAYLSMEFLEGKTLDKVISDGFYDKTNHDKIMQVVERIARGLAYAHQEGFVHADLKPNNIFLTSDGNIKILDFGIAQAVRTTVHNQRSDLTHFDAYTLGGITPSYASLEMLEQLPPEPADDMYALGCVAYSLFAGSHPFLDENGRKLNALEASTRGLEVKTLPGVPRRYMRAIRHCLEFKRENRFANAGEFLDAIKPPAKLHRWAAAFLVVFSLTVFFSWWFAAEQLQNSARLEDLPSSMNELVETIRLGDRTLEAGDVDQAHKLYSQAWEAFQDYENVDPKDQFKLKVVVDERFDRITNMILDEVNEPNADEFRLVQLQLALEFLKRGGVGTLSEEIDAGLIKIQNRLNQAAAE